jgi:hypothetical protein
MATTVKRSMLKHYLLTAVNTWSLVNQGVPSATTNWNPEVEEEAYIADTSATKTVIALAPEMALDMSGKKGDPVYDFIWLIVWGRKTGVDAETYLLTVDFTATPAGVAPNQTWRAKKQKVSVAINSSGGDAIQSLKNNVTLQYIGDPTFGAYKPVDGSYTE